jgi:hypothetical protein
MEKRCDCLAQKYSTLRCLLRVQGLVICFYLGWSGSILQFRKNIIKVGSKSWQLTCISSITLSLPSYTGSALKRELNFCNGYLSCCIFGLASWIFNWKKNIIKVNTGLYVHIWFLVTGCSNENGISYQIRYLLQVFAPEK